MLAGKGHDKRIDHWSLGCIAYEVSYKKFVIIKQSTRSKRPKFKVHSSKK